MRAQCVLLNKHKSETKGKRLRNDCASVKKEKRANFLPLLLLLHLFYRTINNNGRCCCCCCKSRRAPLIN